MERGLVVKMKKKSCIVLTTEGEYLEVPLPKGGVSRVGQEIQLEKKKSVSYLRYLMAAACFLVFIFAGQLYFGQAPRAAAYLTIDINPSIELAVSVDSKVISARGLNSDGEKVLAEVNIKKLNLREAVELIVAQAIADQYLKEKDDNVILATLTVNEGAEPVVSLDSIYDAVINQVESKNVDAEVIIEPVKPELRQEAEKSGISTGRYFLLLKSGEKGVPVSVSEINSMSLGKLEKVKKVTFVELFDQGGEESSRKPANEIKPLLKGIYTQRRLENSEAEKEDKSTVSKKQNANEGKGNIEELTGRKDKEEKQIQHETRNDYTPKADEGEKPGNRNDDRGGKRQGRSN